MIGLLAIFAAVYINGVYSDEQKDPRLVQVEECARENNLDIKLLDTLHTNLKLIKTREIQCFSACLLKKRGLMNSSGKYTKFFEESELGKECKLEYGKDDCETAGNLMSCTRQNEFKGNIKVTEQKS